MEQKPNSEASEPKTGGAWKVVAYFAVLAVLVWLGGFVLESMRASDALSGFAKANELLTEMTDVAKHRDDSIVTVWSLALTFLLVLPLAWTYSITKPRALFDPNLAQILIVMGMVVCGMMMIIQDNFSRALALVGAVSAVSFRAGLKDPKDAVFLLISIALGMGTGLRVYRVATLLMLVMCLLFLILWKVHPETSPALGKKGKKKHRVDVPSTPAPAIDAGGAPSA